MIIRDADTLDQALATIFRREVLSVRQTRSPYSSSFAIEVLEVQFDDGESLPAVFKNFGTSALLPTAKIVKPAFLYDPVREIQVYDSLLSLLDTGTAAFYGSVVDAATERYWLFIEKVPGIELYQFGDFDVWLEVARWLAGFHALDACAPTRARKGTPALMRCDAAFYRTWLERAQRNVHGRIDAVTRYYDRVIDVLCSLPQSVIHGEFYAPNILIQERTIGWRVCPVDWEMAAVGPGLLDVAALASGKWTRGQRLRIAEAYCSALPERLRPLEVVTAFDCCQLQIALQWLGWSKDWVPPQEHAHDWLAEVGQLMSQEPLRTLLG
jgi:hypothetical protein